MLSRISRLAPRAASNVRPSTFRPSTLAYTTRLSSSSSKDPKGSTPSYDASQQKPSAAEPEPEFHELPDLTQGIPSTFEFEQAARKKGSQNIGDELSKALSVSAAQSSQGGSGDDKSSRDSSYKSSAERKQEAVAKYSLGLVLFSIVAGAAYMGRDWDSEGEAAQHPKVPNGWGIGLWWNRVRARMTETVMYYQEPAFDKLLPILDPSLQKPYTLCISLEDMLIHSSWDRQRGWTTAKRPGVDYFLRYLSQYYELVLFTTVPSMNALPTVQKLDPFQFIMFPLFREATKYEDGEVVKDLSYLNRDLSKVIMIDTNGRRLRKQPENAIILPKWKGNPRDTDLVDLVPFLEYLATMQTSDVRKVIKSFDGKKIPEEFARREAISRAKFEKQLEARKPKSSASNFVGGLLGLKAGVNPTNPDDINPAEAFAQGKMLHDIARERGQRYYQMLESDLKANGEKYLKEQREAMEKQQQEAMNSMMGSFSTMFVPSQEKK
ncbi:mitochondrial inner membrane protein required for protein import [Ceratocystis pirilliformis]|uniref:Mitochondrial import inner membrane translocase subunit TIM50 n=1 Tax=Ceratocystis pirilliformis TaxID=259994 RepID=A0ABR3YNV0_9PEZI